MKQLACFTCLGQRFEMKPAKEAILMFIHYDPKSRFNAFDLVGIKRLLEDELHIPVDVTTRDRLHPGLRPQVEQSAVRIF